MNKEYYKNAFSAVCPSDEAIERMLSMTEKRKRIFRHKGPIIVLAVIAALICGTFTVNAATDGTLFHGIRVILNGEEIEPDNYENSNIKVKSYVDEEGRKMTAVEKYDENGELLGSVIEGHLDNEDTEEDNLEIIIDDNTNDDGSGNTRVDFKSLNDN